MTLYRGKSNLDIIKKVNKKKQVCDNDILVAAISCLLGGAILLFLCRIAGVI